MNELQVVAEQTTGAIKWNYGELKQQLMDEMKAYESIVYTDENIKDAKKDVAALRKLTKEIDDKRIAIKKECLSPYEAFEKEANDLKDIIQKPIAKISEKVKEYEQRRIETVKGKISSYYTEVAGSIPDEIRDKAFQRMWQESWTNATTSEATWKKGIDDGVKTVFGEIDIVSSYPCDFADEGIQKYYETLSMTAAVDLMKSLQNQKKIAEEKVRKEQEEADRRKAEEQRRKEEAERQAQIKVAEQAEEPIPETKNALEAQISQETAATEEISETEQKTPPSGHNEAETGILIRILDVDRFEEVEKALRFYEIRYEVTSR